jgi:hypothetical protein
MEHLCYENAVKRSLLAIDYGVDKMLDYSLHKHGKSVVIAHRDSLAHTSAVVERSTAARREL